jgi:TolB-like protein/tetratricopeptide (TPR) repeat protein
MPSIIEGYNYDIFISYRQKDNKHDGWVTEFVNNLKGELESTFKEEITVYFDINPHDGLLETHDVDASLKEKLKCLVFISIISRTYCDPKSFAWEHEFKAFVEQASKDQFGLKVKLPNGNVASRVLPIRIHDLDIADIKECESVLGGVLRGVGFIYKESGFNRPLKPDDEEKININKTKYRNQISKVALAVKEIISGLKNEPLETFSESKEARLIEDKPFNKEKSIIVLPFENISPDPDQDYFSDGLTEEIITDLSHIHDLLVISRSSAMTFKGTKKKIQEIVKDVNVRYALEGSVRKAGNNLRITAQLIDGVNDTHIWAEKYSGTLDDVFHIQEKVSRSIADALMLKLSPKETKTITDHKVENSQVYECYLKAKQDLWKYTEDSLTRAEQNLKNGLKILGEHELLYAGLGQVYFQFYDSGIRQEEEYLDKLKDCIIKIFKYNPNSANGFQLSGLLKLKKENALKAYIDFKRAFELNPSDSETMLWLFYILSFQLGRNSLTVPLVKRVFEIDPLNPVIYCFSSLYYYMEGNMEKAQEESKKWHEMAPDSAVASWYYSMYMGWNHDYQGAYDFIDHFCQTNPENLFAKVLMLFKNCLQHNKDAALPLFTKEIKQVGWNDYGLSWYIANYYAMIDEKDESLKWLERAVEWGLINYPLLSEIDPIIETIRGEERFKKLMEHVKYEWENFEV